MGICLTCMFAWTLGIGTCVFSSESSPRCRYFLSGFSSNYNPDQRPRESKQEQETSDTTMPSPSSLSAPRTTYYAWREFFATRDTNVLLRQCSTAEFFDKYLCIHFSRALKDELSARHTKLRKETRKPPPPARPKQESPKQESELVWV